MTGKVHFAIGFRMAYIVVMDTPRFGAGRWDSPEGPHFPIKTNLTPSQWRQLTPDQRVEYERQRRRNAETSRMAPPTRAELRQAEINRAGLEALARVLGKPSIINRPAKPSRQRYAKTREEAERELDALRERKALAEARLRSVGF